MQQLEVILTDPEVIPSRAIRIALIDMLPKNLLNGTNISAETGQALVWVPNDEVFQLIVDIREVSGGLLVGRRHADSNTQTLRNISHSR